MTRSLDLTDHPQIARTGKTEVLTDEDMRDFRMYPEVLRYLEQYRLGCGRGESVAWLRSPGYRGFGVDIDPRYIDNGRQLLRRHGLDADAILTIADPDGRTGTSIAPARSRYSSTFEISMRCWLR